MILNLGTSTEMQSKKFDADKLRFDLIPPEVEKAIATILTFGANKYGANNWQKLPDFNARFTAALMRHLNAWRLGEKDDLEGGFPHLWHMACNIAFLIWKEEKMGCYDTVIAKCPDCGEEIQAQSKSGECTLGSYPTSRVPRTVALDVNRHAPFFCVCGASWVFESLESHFVALRIIPYVKEQDDQGSPL